MKILVGALLTVAVASVSPARAQEPKKSEDACTRWAIEIRSSEDYRIAVHTFRGDEVPPKVYRTERGRLRGPLLKVLEQRSTTVVELPPGVNKVWIEPYAVGNRDIGLGWSESSAIVASPKRRTRIKDVRIRTRFRCEDETEG